VCWGGGFFFTGVNFLRTPWLDPLAAVLRVLVALNRGTQTDSCPPASVTGLRITTAADNKMKAWILCSMHTHMCAYVSENQSF